MAKISDILEYWFGTGVSPSAEKKRLWFFKSDQTDTTIRERFSHVVEQAFAGELDHWTQSDEGLVALTIVLDQFPRNIYRGTPRSFAYDEKARAIIRRAIDAERDLKLPLYHRVFLYLPLEHSEALADQALSLEKYRRLADDAPDELKGEFERTYDYAVRHTRIIEAWGRYPHRNEILGRESTPEEIEFLKTRGSSF
jgi:uncharacterized protein (DUF924 family)